MSRDEEHEAVHYGHRNLGALAGRPAPSGTVDFRNHRGAHRWRGSARHPVCTGRESKMRRNLFPQEHPDDIQREPEGPALGNYPAPVPPTPMSVKIARFLRDLAGKLED